MVMRKKMPDGTSLPAWGCKKCPVDFCRCVPGFEAPNLGPDSQWGDVRVVNGSDEITISISGATASRFGAAFRKSRVNAAKFVSESISRHEPEISVSSEGHYYTRAQIVHLIEQAEYVLKHAPGDFGFDTAPLCEWSKKDALVRVAEGSDPYYAEPCVIERRGKKHCVLIIRF